MSIQVLPSEVVDQIAAGEVVERPAHLVKELVENSLDAGATQITVEMAEGGRSIKVSDNGKGIVSQELPLALKRFATSKIKSTDDLWSLRSFGFRGEALASIAAVSKLQLISKHDRAEKASQILSEFGSFSDVLQIGHGQGTTVKVESLFENVPARLKFLKTPAAEHQQIKNTLRALALNYPNVEVKIIEEGKLWALWPATDSKLQRAQSVLQQEKLYASTFKSDGVTVEAVYSDPHNVQKTSKQIWIFAQNRWIQDRSLQAAVMEAYRNLLMHGEFPTCCVWVDVDPQNIDINIHPTKSAVKFVEPSRIFKAVYACLRNGLETAPWMQGAFQPPAPSDLKVEESFYQTQLGGRESASYFSDVQVRQKIGLKDFQTLSESRETYAPPVTESLFDPQGPIGLSEIHREASVPVLGAWESLQVIGQAGLTYLVCESRDGMVFVDQHAAHERVMFERLMLNWKNKSFEIQNFLIPLAVDLSADQREVIEKHQNDFLTLGIEIEILGPETVGVISAPVGIQERALYQVIKKTADDLIDYGGSKAFEKNLGEIFSMMACHSAVRAGQALNLEQMKELLRSMDEFPLSSFCPHGRPVSVVYPFAEVEKDFGRRV